jgi:hypothetical protein
MRLSRKFRDEHDLLHINRIEAINSTNASLTIGWQVRFQRKSGYLSKFFSDSGFGGKEAALDAARAYRNDVLKARHEDLGQVLTQRMFILPHLPKNNTSGILGVNRSSRRERSGNVFSDWQSTYLDGNGKVRNHSYSTHRFGEIGALLAAIRFRRNGIASVTPDPGNIEAIRNINRQIESYDQLIWFLENTAEDEVQGIGEYLARSDVPSSTKKRFVEARITQRQFRDSICSYFNNRCAITGASQLLIASHIKPWARSTDKERIDTYNGLLLSPTYDKAFDAGFITFKNSGSIIICKQFAEDAARLGILNNATISRYTAFHDRYMEYHRAHVFKAATGAA